MNTFPSLSCSLFATNDAIIRYIQPVGGTMERRIVECISFDFASAPLAVCESAAGYWGYRHLRSTSPGSIPEFRIELERYAPLGDSTEMELMPVLPWGDLRIGAIMSELGRVRSRQGFFPFVFLICGTWWVCQVAGEGAELLSAVSRINYPGSQPLPWSPALSDEMLREVLAANERIKGMTLSPVEGCCVVQLIQPIRLP